MSQQKLLSRDQVAKRWSVSKETVKRREKAGLLKALHINCRLIRYRIEDVVAYENSLAKGSGASADKENEAHLAGWNFVGPRAFT